MPVHNPPASSTRVLAQGNVASSHTGNTTETTLAQVTIPAGSMGANGRLRITTIWSMTNSANNKTMRVRFNHATTGAAFMNQAQTTQATNRFQCEIINRNSQSSQLGGHAGGTGGWGVTTTAAITSTVDTSVDTTLYITAQLALGSETLTLESYLVELIS